MCRRVYLLGVIAFALSLSLVRADTSLQEQYLRIYLKINDAEHLEKQGDYRGALDDFKDCYDSLAKIHKEDPNWESALVIQRMNDCKAKILDLQPKAEAQPIAPSPTPTPIPTASPVSESLPPATGGTSSENPDDVSSLKARLMQVEEELRVTKENLKDSQVQVETYRSQLETVNQQLAALKSQQSVDDRMGKLLSENKELTDKLASAQQEITTLKSTTPKSNLAMVQIQLKNLQDQFDASQAANKALQQTTTTLQQQLDQAQADLVAANQKLAAASTGSPEYDALKRENEVMRDILTRELQEQAHRDMAKRLAQEEFDNLKLKSKVLQEQIDILGSPMTPPTNDQERALLASLRVPGPDINQPPAGNVLSVPAAGSASMADTNAPSSTSPEATAATTSATNNASETNVASTPSVPSTSTPDNTINQPPVTVVDNTSTSATTPGTNTAPETSAATTPSSAPATPEVTTPSTNVAEASAPIPPTTPSSPPSTPSMPDTSTVTKSVVPPTTTTYTDTTIKNNDTSRQTDPTEYSTKARLPDDMRDVAQQAADLFKMQRYDEAAEKYQGIIDKYPESLYAWSNLGVVRFQQGKLNEALKALQQAVKLSPTDAFSYSNLGIVYYQLNQYENAIDALNSAKALDPNDAKTHNYLGCACSQKGWQEVAEKEFRKAIELDPNFGDAHFNLALIYATSKPPSLELARREYNRALELGIAKDTRLEKLLQIQPSP